ncbi:MAG: C39 family peptidase [Chloroflexota bacterium]
MLICLLIATHHQVNAQTQDINIFSPEDINNRSSVIVVPQAQLTPIYANPCASHWKQLTDTDGHTFYTTLNTKQRRYSTNRGRWLPDLPKAGVYRVEAFIPRFNAFDWPCPVPHNRRVTAATAQASYRVFHADGTTSVRKNQRVSQDQHIDLGSFYFEKGTKGFVELVDLNNESDFSSAIVFSTMQFTYVEDVLTPQNEEPSEKPEETLSETSTETPNNIQSKRDVPELDQSIVDVLTTTAVGGNETTLAENISIAYADEDTTDIEEIAVSSPFVILENLVGEGQQFNLSCESRSAVDLAAYFGITIDEVDFFETLPKADNPHKGFVGDVHAKPGSMPPDGYGVYAEPVAAVLQQYGLCTQARYEVGLDALRTELDASRPVIVWGTYDMKLSTPQWYTASDGTTFAAIRYEHSFLAAGYDAGGIYLIDAWDGVRKYFGWGAFERSWSQFNQMAVMVCPPDAYTPSQTSQSEPRLAIQKEPRAILSD